MSASLPIDPESLTRHLVGIRRLAFRLVHDRDLAEDVAQEAMVAALTNTQPIRQGLGPWLRGVTRRRAADAVRVQARRHARERRAAGRESVPGAAEVLERLGAQREVADALAALGDPYRQALYLRYFEGLPPRVIAEQLDLPLQTVKSHLKRGLARLRSEFDQRHGGQRHAWATMMAPLFSHGIGPDSAGTGVAAAAGGALIMGLKLKLGITLAIALLVAALVWGPPLRVDLPAGSEPAGTTAASDPQGAARLNDEVGPLLAGRESLDEQTPGSVRAEAPASTSSQPTPPPHETSDRGPSIQGVVLDARGRPVPNALVQVVGPGHMGYQLRTGKTGSFQLAGLAQGQHKIQVDHSTGAVAPRHVLPSEEQLEFRLERGFTIRGVLRTPDGRPVANAAVDAIPRDGLPRIGTPLTRDDGTFELGLLVKDLYDLRARPSGDAAIRFRETSVKDVVPGGSVVEIIVEAGLRIRGRVELKGAAVEGARVFGRAVTAAGRRDRTRRQLLRAATGEDGSFEAPGLADGDYELEISCGGHLLRGLRVAAGSELDADLAGLVRVDGETIAVAGVTLSGRAVDHTGIPLSGHRVMCRASTAKAADRGFASVAIDSKGYFSLRGLPAGTIDVLVNQTGWPRIERKRIRLIAGQTMELELKAGRQGMGLFGHVADSQGKRVSGVWLRLHFGEGGQASGSTDDHGRFFFGSLHEEHTGPYELEVLVDKRSSDRYPIKVGSEPTVVTLAKPMK